MPSRVDQLRAEERSVSPSDSDRTRVSTESQTPTDNVLLHLYPRAEIPTIPYKLRFAISPDEWDRRVQLLALYTERSAKPRAELIYFFILCIALPIGIGYPLYLRVLDMVTEDPTGKRREPTAGDEMDAVAVPIAMAIFLFIFFLIPLFLRKYVIRRRLRKETRGWAAVDERRFGKKTVDLQWRVRLPRIFTSGCAVHIPVPPRLLEDDTATEFTTHSRSNSWEDVEALGGAGLARGDSIAGRSMFEGNESGVHH